MEPKLPTWSSDWTVGVRLWVERDGQTILGKGRLELLEGIDRWRSISRAARQMGMSYRRAWLLVQGINAAAGDPLVEAVVGGSHGGGARLTPRGRVAVRIFRDLQQHVWRTAASALPRLVEQSESTTVHLAAAVSLEEVLGQLVADFALQQPTVRVRAVFGASDELAAHILAGSPADLFLSADARQLDRLQPYGLVEPGSRRILAANTLAAIAPAEAALPVRKPDDLERPEVRRLALAEPACPLGGYTRTYLTRLGLYDRLRPRVLWVDNACAVLAALHAGQADAGIVYTSEAATSLGCRLLFRARRDQVLVLYAGAAVRGGQGTGAAQAVLEFLADRAAARRFRACGFLLSPRAT
jgi:molybdenum ABC transporter molybdate-binding protein